MLVRGSGPHIEKLEDELQIARDRIKELEAVLGIGDDLMPLRLLGLTPHEAKLVNVIRRRNVATRTQAMIAMYGGDDDRRLDVLPKVIDVVACNARSKLGRFGVSFGTLRGMDDDGGYHMPGPDKARLARLLASGTRLVTRGRADRKHYKQVNRGVGSAAMHG
jgi:hypothetical protein